MSDAPQAAAMTFVAPVVARTTWKDWLPVLSLLIVIAGVMMTGGRTLAQVADNTRRIEVLERRADQRDDQLSDMRTQIAGMDAKLDLLLRRTPAGGAQ